MARRGEARQLLVTHAVELLEEVGLQEFTGREAARRAGVSHGAPRRHFPTLAALLAAVSITGYQDLQAELEATMAAAPDAPKDQMKAVANAYVAFAVRRPAMFEIMFRHDLLEGSGEGLRSHSLATLAIALDVVTKSGIPDPYLTTVDLWAGIHGLAVLASRDALSVVSPESVDDLVSRQVEAHLHQI